MLVLLCAMYTSAQPNNVLPSDDNSPAPLIAQANAAAEDGVKPNDEYLKSKIDPKPFDREVWNKKRKAIDYSDKRKERDNNERNENNAKSSDGDNQVEENSSSSSSGNWNLNLGPLGQIIMIIGIIGALALLVFILVKLGFLDVDTKIARDREAPLVLEDIEENLHESDLEKALRMALEAEDYRMAIRIYYLSIIKELSIRNWIKWKRDKTNGQYVREMVEKPEGKTFRQLTIAFDRTWYSDEDIVLRHYEVLSPQFQLFMNSIKKK